MKSMTCRDLGGDCDFRAEGTTNEEVIQKMYAHAGAEHPDKIQGMSEEEKAGMNMKMNEFLHAQA